MNMPSSAAALRAAGMALQPVTVGHALILQELRSPFASPLPCHAEIGEVAVALAVLCRPYRQVARWPRLWAVWACLHVFSEVGAGSAARAIRAHLERARDGLGGLFLGEEAALDPIARLFWDLRLKLAKSKADVLEIPLDQAITLVRSTGGTGPAHN